MRDWFVLFKYQNNRELSHRQLANQILFYHELQQTIKLAAVESACFKSRQSLTQKKKFAAKR